MNVATPERNSNVYHHRNMNRFVSDIHATPDKSRWSPSPRTRKTSQQRNQSHCTNHGVEQKIIECLSSGTKTAIGIAKSIGLNTKKDVNSVLYSLQKKNVVVSNRGLTSKPMWSLSEEAMAGDMFRDSSRDISAPGAYSPEEAGLSSDRHHYRHQQRTMSGPYNAAEHRRSKHLPNRTGQNVAMQSLTSRQQMGPKQPISLCATHEPDSGITDDIISGNSTNTSSNAAMTVTSTNNERSVSVENPDQFQKLAAADQHDKNDTGNDSCFDEDDEFTEGVGHDTGAITTRLQDIIGDLLFPDMTYIEDEEMAEFHEPLVTQEDRILILINVEENQVISVSKIAEIFGREIEDIRLLLKSCVEKVDICGDLCSLTDVGKKYVRDKLTTQPHLANEMSPQFGGKINLNSPRQKRPQPQPQLQSGPPPFPKQLVAADPVFSTSSSGVSDGNTSTFQSFPEAFPVKKTEPFQSYRSHMFSTNEGRDEVSVTVPSGQPQWSLGFSPEKSKSNDNFRSIQEFDWKPLAGADERNGAFYLSGTGKEMTDKSGPSDDMMLFSTPVIEKFSREGLTHMPSSVSMTRFDPFDEGNSYFDSQFSGMTSSASMEMGDQQMGFPRSDSQQFSVLPDRGFLQSQSQSLAGDPASISANDTSGSTLKITSESFAALNKNPISALMEYAQSRRMQAIIEVVSQRGPSHRPVFVMAAKVGSRQFAGVTCHNKKDGRKEAADVALRTLIAEGQYSAFTPTPSINVAPESMTHFDKIAALTHQTFNTLIATIPENLAGRKVIAGLVMKCGEDDVGMVISIGTGNRCITGDKLSLEGNTVNDSHAEIITRRGFMRFLYQQLESYEFNKPHSLFEMGSNGRFRVKPNVTFHLYISTAPCGDGALFSPRDVESNSSVIVDTEQRDHHPTFTSNVQGLLRTKMEGGEGTIPVDNKDITIQTWDGVVRGERLRTMSCTDKICRWNVLGLQGALLSHFIEPIYLHSLTLGFLYDHGHLSRAVCCRLDRDEPKLDSTLPSEFHLNHPWLGRVTACQPLRETQKTKAFSINWTVGDEKAEVLDGTSGHCYTAVEKKLFSRLAKHRLYDSFKQVAQKFGRSDLLQKKTYRDSKLVAKDFQAAKATMISKFQQMGCGWVKKPVEEEMFS